MIALVGAGPGDPELLTVRGLRRLQDADVVVHDALVGTGVLALARTDAELIDVGKRPGAPVPQELINELLVTLGRGGEEALALTAAGLPFEVVPGVSSVVAAPAAAGIPVTHRGVSASFTVVTGHRQRGEAAVNWAALAQAGGTILVLMGVSERAVIAAALIAGGMSPDTPVAAIRHATSVEQHVVRCALSDLADTPVESPATIVIGAVAAFDLYVNLAESLPASVNPHG